MNYLVYPLVVTTSDVTIVLPDCYNWINIYTYIWYRSHPSMQINIVSLGTTHAQSYPSFAVYSIERLFLVVGTWYPRTSELKLQEQGFWPLIKWTASWRQKWMQQTLAKTSLTETCIQLTSFHPLTNQQLYRWLVIIFIVLRLSITIRLFVEEIQRSPPGMYETM